MIVAVPFVLCYPSFSFAVGILMSHLYVATCSMMVLAVASYSFFKFFADASSDVASGLAGFFILSIGPLRDALEKSAIKRSDRRQNPIRLPTLQEKSVGPIKLIGVGAVMIFASLQVAGVLGGFFAGVLLHSAGLTDISVVPLENFGMISLPLVIVLVYWTAHWISRNATKYGLAVCAASVLIGRLMVTWFDKIAFSNNPNVMIFYDSNNDLVLVVGALLVMAPAMIVGYYRGRRMREAMYLKFLMDVLPPDTRSTIYSLVADEAQSAMDAKRSIKKAQQA